MLSAEGKPLPINDYLRASEGRAKLASALPSAAVNAGVSPNLPLPDRSLRGGEVRRAA